MQRTSITFLLVIASILLVDSTSKYLTFSNLPFMTPYLSGYPYGGLGVFQDFLGIEFSLVHTKNTGAAWGLFNEYQNTLLVLRVLFTAALLIYLFFYNKEKEYDFPLILIVSGAIGNIIDYFAYGHVIDMFNFVFWGYDYPVFNVADSVIFIGMAWLIIVTIFSKPNKPQRNRVT